MTLLVLIITHGDQDGAICAGLLGQEYPQASLFVQAVPARDLHNFSDQAEKGFLEDRKKYNEKILNKIIKTREKELIIIADIGITDIFKEVVFKKLEKSPNIRFLIFDHHIDPNISHPRVQVFYEEVNNAYEIIRRWKREKAGLPPRKRWKKKS